MEIGTIVLLIVFGGAIFWAISIYNGLVAGRNQVKNAFSQIDVQLERRYDLIPNLVETAKGYLKHERETLEAVTQARNIAQTAAKAAAQHPEDGAAVGRLGKAETELGGALGRLLAVAEQYPDLKANQTMQELMEELASTENKVSFARQFFNDAVMSYNNSREQFPNNLMANPFGFKPAQHLEISTPEARKAVKVSF